MCFVPGIRRRSRRPGERLRNGTGNESGWRCIGSKVKGKEDGVVVEEEQEEGRCRTSFSKRGEEGMVRGKEASEERQGGI